jgi:integrase
MTVYRKTGATVFTVAVPTRTGVVKRSTGTADRSTARAMDRMIEELGPRGRRDWWALDLLASKRLTVAELYDWFRANDLDGLRVHLDDVDLEPYVAEWRARLTDRVAEETAEKYELYVRSLIIAGMPFPRSRFTLDVIDLWLGAYPAGRSTKRKAHTAMSVFAQELVRRRVLAVNPLRQVAMPRAAGPRLRYIDVAEMQRLADAQIEPHRTLSALLGGSGIELSVALALVRRDVDVQRREIRAAGTKTHCRDRIVRVAEWAWPYVERHIAKMLPNAPLFPGLDRFHASDVHRETCAALDPAIEDYQLRDQRHSYAVRAARAGTPAELIARQLGHVNAVLVLKVYGRFMPSQQERDKWEKIAAAQDAEALKAAKKAAKAAKALNVTR